MLIASQYTFHWYREDKGLIGPGGGTLPPKPSKEPDPEPTYTDQEWDQAHQENEQIDNEKARAKKIAENIPPVIEDQKSYSEVMEEQLEPRPEPKGTMTAGQLLTMTEEEEYANAGITKEEAEKKPPEIEDSTIAEEIEEAMKGEGDDLDKWNNWVEAANQKAEQEPVQKKTPKKGSNYIVKEEGFQKRKKTNPGE